MCRVVRNSVGMVWLNWVGLGRGWDGWGGGCYIVDGESEWKDLLGQRMESVLCVLFVVCSGLPGSDAVCLYLYDGVHVDPAKTVEVPPSKSSD